MFHSEISYKLVWDVACNEVPQLRGNLEKIASENPEDFG